MYRNIFVCLLFQRFDVVELPAEVVVEVLHFLLGVSEQRQDDETLVVQIVEVLVVLFAEGGGESKCFPRATAFESCSRL